MRQPITLALVALTLTANMRLAHAAEYASWEEYLKANRYKCPGPLDTLKQPRELRLGQKSYIHEGYRLVVKNPDADTTIKIGVISAVKDVTANTKHNLQEAVATFRREGVEWLVVNGDLALEEFDLEEVLKLLGESGFPTLVVIGNSESKSSFGRVYKEVAAKYPNLINGVLVRQLILDDAELWTMPGYHDKNFVHQGAGCLYGKEDIDTLLSGVKPKGDVPIVLVAHGPPLGSGKHALDYFFERRNVGDPELARLIKGAKIPFGLFGHILEAGGNVVGKDLASPVQAGKLMSELYINAGSLSADPWKMNDGSVARGFAFIVTIDGQKAKYEMKRFTPPAEE